MIYQVATNATPLKTDTSSNGKIIARLDRFSKVDVLEIDRRWAQVLYNDEKYYISTMYIIPCEDESDLIDDTTIETNISDTTLSQPTTNNVEHEVYDTNIEELISVNDSDTLEAISPTPMNPEYVEVYGNLIVKYIDIDSKDSISEDKSYDNLQLGVYTVYARCIDGYSIVDNSSESVTLSNNSKIVVITFLYKKTNCTVTINYLDYNSSEIISSCDIYDNLDFGTYSYSSKSIDGYTALYDTINISLDSTLPECSLNFVYKKVN